MVINITDNMYSVYTHIHIYVCAHTHACMFTYIHTWVDEEIKAHELLTFRVVSESRITFSYALSL